MKKLGILLLCLLLLTGCNKKKEEDVVSSNEVEEQFVLKKKDESKDYVSLIPLRNIEVDNTEYVLNNLEINIDSSDIDNVNLEIKTFVNNSNKNYVVSDNRLVNGTVVNYEYWMSNKYLSIIQKYYLYVDGIKGEENDNVYNISLETGKVISNQDLLKLFELDENKLFEKLENEIESEDTLYTILNIKNNGYKLFVNSDNQLGIIYYEATDEESIRKELILS